MYASSGNKLRVPHEDENANYCANRGHSLRDNSPNDVRHHCITPNGKDVEVVIRLNVVPVNGPSVDSPLQFNYEVGSSNPNHADVFNYNGESFAEQSDSNENEFMESNNDAVEVFGSQKRKFDRVSKRVAALSTWKWDEVIRVHGDDSEEEDMPDDDSEDSLESVINEEKHAQVGEKSSYYPN